MDRLRDSAAECQSPLMNRQEAAAYLGVKPQTLAVWACTGRYELPVYKVGRLPRYRRGDLDRWLEQRKGRGRESL